MKKKLHAFGVVFSVETGDIPGDVASGFLNEDGRKVLLRKEDEDGPALAHELAHVVQWGRSRYRDEREAQMFEDLFTILRDPRNKWLLQYFAGD